MNGRPPKAAVPDYESRWGIEPPFSDFKSRGFDLEATPLRAPDRLDRLLLIMALAMHGCVRAGQEDARDHPTPLEKNPNNRPIRIIGPFENSPVAPCRGSSAVCGCSKTTPNSTTLAVLLSRLRGDEELIGGEADKINGYPEREATIL
ncbi:MAG: hypothetical protein IPL59_02630 [Candidatus Competibacteraceae bacterium]|nr:hypothetical protein [Candidatus Competibacteraceae bacterium]